MNTKQLGKILDKVIDFIYHENQGDKYGSFSEGINRYNRVDDSGGFHNVYPPLLKICLMEYIKTGKDILIEFEKFLEIVQEAHLYISSKGVKYSILSKANFIKLDEFMNGKSALSNQPWPFSEYYMAALISYYEFLKKQDIKDESQWIDPDYKPLALESETNKKLKNGKGSGYDCSGYIYVMYDEKSTYYKIGKALDVNSRVKGIQTSNPFTSLVKYYKTRNYTTTEHELHALFNEKRIIREWFSLDETDLKAIEDYFTKN